ncbi:MAG: DUF721 domain-containing protein [Beijerinckiaceae bacterium]
MGSDVAEKAANAGIAARQSFHLRKKNGVRPLQALIDECLEPTLKAKGFASSAVHLHWTEIAGANLAQWSEPVSLKWPPVAPGADPDKRKGGATLTVKVEGAFALEMQHLAPQIIERANGFFGWRCVEKLMLKQGSIRKTVPRAVTPKRTLTVADSKHLDKVLAEVESPDLKAALARLGVGIMRRSPGTS